MTSVLNVDTIAAKNGTSPVTLTKQSAPKAWIRFGGNDITVDDSFNTGSLVDGGTGKHSYSFTNNFNSTSYIHVAGSGTSSNYSSTTLVATRCHENSPTTSQVGCNTFTVAAAAATYDAPSISSTNDGDLA